MLLTTLNTCGRSEHFLDRTIKGTITIGTEWTDITPSQPLKVERERQEIVLYLEKPFVGDFIARGIRLPDGSLTIPEIQLIDSDGNAHKLEYSGFRGDELIRFALPEQSTIKEYRGIRIRSDKPINCKEIIWSCFNLKDVDYSELQLGVTI